MSVRIRCHCGAELVGVVPVQVLCWCGCLWRLTCPQPDELHVEHVSHGCVQAPGASPSTMVPLNPSERYWVRDGSETYEIDRLGRRV